MIIKDVDRWDRREYTEALEYDMNLQYVEEKGTQKIHNFADFMLSVFGGLYKYDAKLIDEKDVHPIEEWEYKAYKEISNLPLNSF